MGVRTESWELVVFVALQVLHVIVVFSFIPCTEYSTIIWNWEEIAN